MSIDITIKKKVADQWHMAFPDLKPFGKNKFYKVIGPVITGIELIKLPDIDKYRPHFVIYGLWSNRNGNDLKACLVGPFLLKQYLNPKKQQLDLLYSADHTVLNESFKYIYEQSPISFQHDISLRSFLVLIDEYIKTPPLSVAPFSFFVASLQEAKFNLALYISTMEANKILETILDIPWNEEQFKLAGVDIYQWLAGLKDRMINRETFIKTIRNNKEHKKLTNLNYSELVL